MVNSTILIYRDKILEPLRKTVEANEGKPLDVAEERRHLKRVADLKILEAIDSEFQHSMLMSEAMIQLLQDIKKDIYESNGKIRVEAASKVLKVGENLQEEYLKLLEDE